jgi:hypothetical protein
MIMNLSSLAIVTAVTVAVERHVILALLTGLAPLASLTSLAPLTGLAGLASLATLASLTAVGLAAVPRKILFQLVDGCIQHLDVDLLHLGIIQGRQVDAHFRVGG